MGAELCFLKKKTIIQFILSQKRRGKTSETVALYNIVRASNPNHCNMSTRRHHTQSGKGILVETYGLPSTGPIKTVAY
jgi:hypothetical protein